MKTIVYIDGQNFLYKLADVLIDAKKIKSKQDLHTISIRKLIEDLLSKDHLEIRFYGTRLKLYKNTNDIAEKSRIMIDSQRRLRNSLVKQNIMFVESGKLKLRDGDICKQCGAQDSHFQEKGVDVKIAVDLVEDSLLKDTERMVLVSSDTDLVPAVLAVLKHKKSLIYVGFSNKLTNALSNAATETQIIRDKEIIEAFNDANLPK